MKSFHIWPQLLTVLFPLETEELVEVKCPYKHGQNLIEVVREDETFCLSKSGDEVQLRWQYNYYFLVTGQCAVNRNERKACSFLLYNFGSRSIG